MDGIITTFHIDLKLLIAQFVNFAIVCAVLYFLVLKPLLRLMHERTKTIEDGLQHAKESEERLVNVKVREEEILKSARHEAEKLIAEGRALTESKTTEMIERAKAETKRLSQSNMESVARERATMKEELRDEIATIVAEATSRVFHEFGGNTVTSGAINHLIEKSYEKSSSNIS